MGNQELRVPPLLKVVTGASIVWSVLSYFAFPVVILYYVLIFSISPYADLWLVLNLIPKCFRKYSGLPWTFNLSSLCVIFTRILVSWPLGTLFWLIDEYLLVDWKEIKIEKPALILGQPRSGTTKLEEVMENDEDFVCLKLFEVTFPFACVQLIVFHLWRLDKQYLNGALAQFIKKTMDEKDKSISEVRSKMRRIGPHHAEEDDLFFYIFYLEGTFSECCIPERETMWSVKSFCKHLPAKRDTMMKEHKKSVQKIMWIRYKYRVFEKGPGPHKLRYLAKWVIGWCAETEALINFYKDADLLFIVRDPRQSLPSWYKVYGMLCSEYNGYNLVDDSPEFRSVFKEMNVEGFKNELKIINQVKEEGRSLTVIDFHKFYQNIPESIESIYSKLNWAVSDEYKNALISLNKEQKGFQKSKTDESQITIKEIEQDFPDIHQILCQS